MTSSGTGAVFFLGSRAHYQALDQPNNHDMENGNTSTETIYNASVEELWPDKQSDLDPNCNGGLGWSFKDRSDTVIYERTIPVACVKRRGKRRSSEALLCDDSRPAALNRDDDTSEQKSKPSERPSVLSFLTSLARGKRRLEPTHVYLRHLDSVLNTCTYRESCRCLDCQGRYFECAEESDEYSSDEDFTPYSQEANFHGLSLLLDDDDEVFLDPKSESDNTSTDLLLEDSTSEEERTVSEVMEDTETDKQLQMEVAASTSAMFNLLLYHPFSCSIQ